MQLLIQLAVCLVFIYAIEAHEFKTYFKDDKNPWDEEEHIPADEWSHYPYEDPFDKYDWHKKYHMPKPSDSDPWTKPKPWDVDPWTMPKPTHKPWHADPWTLPKPIPKPWHADPWTLPKPIPKPWHSDPWTMPKPIPKPWDSDPWTKPNDDSKPAKTVHPILEFDGKLTVYGNSEKNSDSSFYNTLKNLY